MLDESLAPGALPHGLRIYAIGDPHGCAARLEDLHRQIAQDVRERPVQRPLIVHLGDYVDRGPDSAGTLALLLYPRHGIETVNLMGNHEQLMLAAMDPLASGADVDLWLGNGGGRTLASYGAVPQDIRSWDEVPPQHLALLRSLRPSFAAGGYLFTHAGIRPGVALDQQTPEDLAWIREPFLSWSGRLPAVVVHGHTPADGPEIRQHRIGLDTGAVFGGALTCGVLEANRIGFLTA